MVIVILLVLALVFFGVGLFIKGLLWLMIIGGVLLIASVLLGAHRRIRR